MNPRHTSGGPASSSLRQIGAPAGTAVEVGRGANYVEYAVGVTVAPNVSYRLLVSALSITLVASSAL